MINLIAHRGIDNHNFKENTIDAFLYSLGKDYINGIEMDTRLTKDKKVVIFHNPVINLKLINQLTLKQLKKEGKKDNILIPTLEEALSKLNTTKKIIIELKIEDTKENILIKEVLKIIKKYPNLDIYLDSFDDSTVSKLNKVYKKTGLLISKLINHNKIKNKYNFNAVSFSLYKKCPLNKELFIWSVTKKEQYDEIKKLKSSYDINIITDFSYKLATIS